MIDEEDISKFEFDLLETEKKIEIALEKNQKKRGGRYTSMSKEEHTSSETDSPAKKKSRKSKSFEMPNLVAIDLDDADLVITQEFLNKETLREILVETNEDDGKKAKDEACDDKVIIHT